MTRLDLPTVTGGVGSGGTAIGSVTAAGSTSRSVAGGSSSGVVSMVGSGIEGKSAGMSKLSGISSLSLCLMAPLTLSRLLASKLTGAFPGSAVHEC